MKSPEAVLALFQERRRYYAPLHSAMSEIASIYNGESQVNLPDMGRNESAAVPNLLAQGIDQMAGRISSTMPQVIFASEKLGDRTADRRATTAQNVVMGWWESDRLPMKMKNRARNLVAYGLAPTVVRYCPVRKMPTWEVRSPLEAFPALDRIPGTTMPTDVIFAYQRTVGWLVANGYQDAAYRISGRLDTPWDTPMLLLEYIDPDGVVLCVAGTSDPNAYLYGWSRYAQSIEASMRAVVLESYSTGGVMTASVPTRLTLDRPG
ncbi:MAG TPA: hypothetical protein VLS51_00225, partial [Propionibacteriaceae bacterium]|nr:hypothetical protein [Propionibacteriaceae bacterium]